MSESDKPHEPVVARSTLKLKSPVARTSSPPAQSAPTGHSPTAENAFRPGGRIETPLRSGHSSRTGMPPRSGPTRNGTPQRIDVPPRAAKRNQDSASWADEHKSAMQRDMDALGAGNSESFKRR